MFHGDYQAIIFSVLCATYHISGTVLLLWVPRQSQPQPPRNIWNLSHKSHRDASIIRVESSRLSPGKKPQTQSIIISDPCFCLPLLSKGCLSPANLQGSIGTQSAWSMFASNTFGQSPHQATMMKLMKWCCPILLWSRCLQFRWTNATTGTACLLVIKWLHFTGTVDACEMRGYVQQSGSSARYAFPLCSPQLRIAVIF